MEHDTLKEPFWNQSIVLYWWNYWQGKTKNLNFFRTLLGCRQKQEFYLYRLRLAHPNPQNVPTFTGYYTSKPPNKGQTSHDDFQNKGFV